MNSKAKQKKSKVIPDSSTESDQFQDDQLPEVNNRPSCVRRSTKRVCGGFRGR